MFTMPNTGYKDYRCVCGKLLCKGFLKIGFIEIKCKACKNVATINGSERSFPGYYVVGAGAGICTLNDGPTSSLQTQVRKDDKK